MGSRSVLRADAICLVSAAAIAFLLNAFGVPVGGVGFVDAHELALIAGLLLWSPAPRRCWHLSAAGVHALFTAATVAHWETIVSGGMAGTALVATAMHLVFVVLHGHVARGTVAGVRGPLSAVSAEAA